jgi:hypothetical protein
MSGKFFSRVRWPLSKLFNQVAVWFCVHMVIPSMALVVARGITLIKLSNCANILSGPMFVFGTVADSARRSEDQLVKYLPPSKWSFNCLLHTIWKDENKSSNIWQVRSSNSTDEFTRHTYTLSFFTASSPNKKSSPFNKPDASVDSLLKALYRG